MCWSNELYFSFILRRHLYIYALGKTHMRSTPLDVLVVCSSINCVISSLRCCVRFKIERLRRVSVATPGNFWETGWAHMSFHRVHRYYIEQNWSERLHPCSLCVYLLNREGHISPKWQNAPNHTCLIRRALPKIYIHLLRRNRMHRTTTKRLILCYRTPVILCLKISGENIKSIQQGCQKI